MVPQGEIQVTTFIFRDSGTREEIARTNEGISGVKNFLQENPLLEEVVIATPLEGPLYAHVTRSAADPHGIITLDMGAGEKSFTRNTIYTPEGDLSVSCSPDGEEVPVRTINIPFMEYHSEMVDKGMVWVVPGDTPEAFVLLYPGSLHLTDNIEEILNDALEAVRNSVLEPVAG